MSDIQNRLSPFSAAHFALHARRALSALLVAAAAVSAHAEDWIYKSGYMTNALGWKIQVNAPAAGATTLSTVDNGGMVKGYPASGDREDGLYTLDLSQPIVDCDDPDKTYTLVTIGYYEFNGGCNIGTLILPDTLTKWRFGSAVGICGRQGANIDTILPRDFSKDIIWDGGNATFAWGARTYSDELHLRGVTKTGDSGFRFTHGGIQRVFLDGAFSSIHNTTFANSGSTRYDLYFGGGVPGGIADTGYGTGNRGYLHVPAGDATWEAWLETNARAFASSDQSVFAAKFPDHPEPDYVITGSCKFTGAYVRLWHAAPGLEVTAQYQVASGQVSPTYGTYGSRKTGETVTLSCPATTTENGTEYVCRGYRLERTTGGDWSDGTSVESADLSLSIASDTAEAVRVTWLWEPQISASVLVTSDRGSFGTVVPDYGLCTSFPTGSRTFSAPNRAYDAPNRTRYHVGGYRVTDEAGVATEHAGASFDYDTSMGQVVLEWLWTADGYELVTAAPGYLSVAVSPALDAEGYGDSGAVYSLTAASGAGEAAFFHWSGNTAAIASDTTPAVSATLSRPLTLVAEPRCAWHYAGGNPTAITNAIGWRIRGSVSGANFRIGQDSVIDAARVAWDIDDDKHWLDLSLPVVKDSDGSSLTIDGASGNVPFRRSDSAPYLGKLVLGNAFKRWPFEGNAIFGSQSKLSEIVPEILPDDTVSSDGRGDAAFGNIPYRGDVHLRCAPYTTIGNCHIAFTHRGTQNIYFGTNLVSITTTGFSWSYANYRVHFDGFPAEIASSRNTSGDYRFYVFYKSSNPLWADYIAANARKFTVADRSAFETRFPEDAAAGNWPKFTFTSGFFSGTWAKAMDKPATVFLVQ